ncbi:hypothetical protein VP1G_07196 [Cytospora mali]|uniref:Magnesium transport protein CorA n=1 Tax=Cytospora mali TaxID=578113 RepID=A0A194V7R2_CYTMA|nr:hypothetical protein VP1G_07196 [Valsa mali var. pyri (nom. inval.)]
MGDRNAKPTCLSADPHKDHVQDPILHYLGCLEFFERADYFDKHPEYQRQIENELRRIHHLREFVAKDDAESLLVQKLKKSMTAWRGGHLYKDEHGIKAVQQWRLSKGLKNGISQETHFENSEDPHQDHHRTHHQEHQQGHQQGHHPDHHSDTDQGHDQSLHQEYDPDYDIYAHLTRFKNSVPVDELNDRRFHGRFPNHKTDVRCLLEKGNEEKPNPLKRSRNSNSARETDDAIINYFHFPANNMDWIEKAMARYFDEDDVNYDQEPTEGNRTHAYMMLRRQYWKGQQNGGKSSEVHARHLRPLCETVSSDPEHVEASPRNMVLFMPYLHWETDRRREKISQFLDEETEKHRKIKDDKEKEQKNKRQKHRGDLVIPIHKTKGNDIQWTQAADHSNPHQAASTVPRTAGLGFAAKIKLYPRLHRHFVSPIFEKDKDGSVKAGTEVGQVLLNTAMLHEAMSIYRDKKFIEKYLHNDPPLHPRRTLDQAYYWTLKTTRSRDRDQVVYRGTTPEPEHSIDHKTKKWTCQGSTSLATNSPKQEIQESERADAGHDGRAMPEEGPVAAEGLADQPASDKKTSQVGSHCIHCRHYIQEVSRVLMVDQLWMWILDENTIITAFPRRYGVNKQDQSGVHKAIRNRLKSLRHDHIKSVFDLALIILDECSNTFFDRTKTADRQPEVLGIFSQAIGNINNKQTISFHHLWEWTEKLGSLTSRRNVAATISELVAPLVNISPEGRLQREIKDIMDELDIMIYINEQQKAVMKKFVKNAKGLLNHKLNPSKLSTGTKEQRKTELKWFSKMAEELLDDVDDRINELSGLRRSAETTSKSLDDLLALKQQQASVVQAWQSVEQAEEAIKQGRSIMIFTVITIVFLPLAFMSSIFGMNNPEIAGGGPMSLVGVSAGIIFLVLVFAYSAFIRNLCWLAYRYIITWVLVQSRAYDHVYLSLDLRSATLTRKVEDEVKSMKALAKKTKQIRTTQRLKRERSRHDRTAGIAPRPASPSDDLELGFHPSQRGRGI